VLLSLVLPLTRSHRCAGHLWKQDRAGFQIFKQGLSEKKHDG
jgi:hypothetical protein